MLREGVLGGCVLAGFVAVLLLIGFAVRGCMHFTQALVQYLERGIPLLMLRTATMMPAYAAGSAVTLQAAEGAVSGGLGGMAAGGIGHAYAFAIGRLMQYRLEAAILTEPVNVTAVAAVSGALTGGLDGMLADSLTRAVLFASKRAATPLGPMAPFAPLFQPNGL